jgi:hypothetical protein
MKTTGDQPAASAVSIPSSAGQARDDRIYRETGWLSAFIVPFLVAAFYILYFRPTDTKQLFAWEIKPTMTAMMLGAIYIGGAYFFVRAVGAQRWHHIKLGFIPVTVFASLLGIATILHWDRFTHDHISFVTWVALYFTTPFLVIGTWLRNRVTDPGTPDPDDVILAQPLRVAMGAVGVIAFLVSLLLFVQPNLMISVWPWTLTPLTARVVGAMFALGLTALGIGLERRWSAVRLILQAQIFMLSMVLIAALRAWNEFNQANPTTWLFIGGLVVVIVLSVSFYVLMERQRGQISA